MSGVSVAATAVVLAVLVVAATAEPGYKKGGGGCHAKYIPIYHTVYNKVSQPNLPPVVLQRISLKELRRRRFLFSGFFKFISWEHVWYIFFLLF